MIEKFYRTRPDDFLDPLTLQYQIKGLMPFFDKGTGGVFLDVGCNNGNKTLCLASIIGAEQIIGVDFYSSALIKASGKGVLSISLDINQNGSLPFPSNTFDCIHLGEVIEHLFSPDLILIEIARLLKPHGYAVITTPNLASWRNRLILLLGWQPFATEVSTEVKVGNPIAGNGPLAGHIRMFVPRALVDLCSFYGLAVEKLGGWMYYIPAYRLGKTLHRFDMFLIRFFPSLSEGIVIKVRRLF